MTWERELFELFDDLESQAGALHDAERTAELADRSRAAYADVTLASRLVAAVDTEVALDVCGVGRVGGRLARTGDGWLLVVAGPQEWLVVTAAVTVVRGAPSRSVPEVAWSPLTKLGLTSALRRLGEAGAPCVVRLRDGAQHSGVVRRIGADFLELETGERGEAALVAFAALAAVQSRP
jgi:hypothetical protein